LGRAPHCASGTRVSGISFSITSRARDAKLRDGREPDLDIRLPLRSVLERFPNAASPGHAGLPGPVRGG
jgi:hypothetical protein